MSCISPCGPCCSARAKRSSRGSIGAALATSARNTSAASAPRMSSCAGASVLYTPFVLFAIVLGAFGIILVGAGLVSLFRLRVWRFTVRTLVGLLLVSLGTIARGLALGVQGYQALTREDVAARISVQPSAPQQFTATVRYPDGRSRTFDLKGDEI